MTEWGTLVYELAFEALFLSCLLWVAAELVTRLLPVSDHAWRARFFVVTVVLPVLFVPLAHLMIRPVVLGFALTPLEALMASLLNASPVWPELFLGMGAVLLGLGAVPVCKALAMALKLRRDSVRQPRSDAWIRCNDALGQLASRLGVPAPRLVLTGEAESGCFALGPLGSYIVLSEDLVGAVDDEELEALLAHELGHATRRDTALDLAASVCRQLLAFSPFSQGAYRSFACAREQATDDLAVRWCRRPLALASSLVKACRLRPNGHRYVLNSGLVSSWTALESRIDRLMDRSVTDSAGSRCYPLVFAGLLSLVVALALLTF